MKLYQVYSRAIVLTIMLIAGSFSMVFAVGLSGTYTIYSGGSYNTVQLAITALNANGVAGPVIFNIGIPGSATQYTETITAPLSILFATLPSTATNTVTFQQAPTNTGANPLITSYTGTATTTSATQDGIWRLVGADYITIDGVDLLDKTANTTATTTMEYGYALYKQSATNGCQNNIIKNCTITLNRVNFTAGTAPASNGSTGILVTNATATAATTVLTPTSAAGANSNNDFYSNTIQNCNIGINLIGYAAASPFTLSDQGNDIGGTALSTGNTIINYGGGASATTTACGVSTINQQTLNVSYNNINNNNGSGVNHPSDLRGILIGASTSASSTITFNTISVKGAGTTQVVAAIDNQSGGTAASNTVNINNNTITGSYTTSTTGAFIGIYNNGTGAPAILNMNNNVVSNISVSRNGLIYGIINFGVALPTLNITGNTISGYTITNAAGIFYAIYNTGAVTAAININSNNIGTSVLAPVTYSAANTAAQVLINNTAGTTAAALSISNNNIYLPTYSTAASSSNAFISNTAATLSQAISSNTFYGSAVNATGDVSFISNVVTLPANGVQNVNSNSLTGNFSKTGAGGNVYIYNGGSVTSASTANINHNNNNFSGITVTGATVIQGWVYTDAGSPTSYIAQNNTFTTWTGGTSAVTAININISGNNNSITANQINNITGAGAITGIVTSVGNGNIFSNTLNTLTSSGASASTAISVTGGTTQEVYRNKIYDIDNSNASGTVNGILVSAGTTVNVYNNLIGDLKTPAGSGTDPIRGINITSTTATTTINVYYNTIYLNATSSATNFGSTGIYHTTNATATTATLNLRNNIISNNSTPKGTGFTVAYRRSSTALTNYGSTSNNNLFYGGTPSASQLIFYDGTNSESTLSGYKTRVGPTRDAASVTEDLSAKFLSIIGTSASYLHIDNLVTTAIKGAAVNISTYTTDFDGQVRAGNSGYLGSGTNPDIGADEILYTNGWLGTISTDWADANNWYGGVPTADSDVDIPAGKTNYPSLTTGTYIANNINVRASGSVTLTGGTLQIGGGIVTGGTFSVSGGGIVEFNGNTAQTIPAAAFATNTIANLKINNSTGVTLAGTLNLTGILYPALGAFNANSNFTLISSATQTALVDGTGAGSITGNLTMQRYLASGYGYKYFSSPVQSATVASFSSVVDLNASFPNFYNYTESNVNTGFGSYTTTTNPLTPFVGYAVDFGSSTNPLTIAISGIPNNGNQSITLYNTNKTFTQGFNLVGNPYPSPVDWNAAAGWTKTNIDNALYYYDSGTVDQYTGTYSTYINGTSSDGTATNIIASMQGFFVHVSNGSFPVTGTLATTNAVRINNLTAYFHKYNSLKPNSVARALVRLSAAYGGDAKSADPVVFYTDNSATKKFDKELDAVKLMNINDNVPNLYIRNADNLKLAINAVAAIDSNTIVPLSLQLAKGGSVDFSLLAAENVPGGLTTYIYDAHIGKQVALKNGAKYTVNLAAGTYDNRFYISYKDDQDIAPDADNFYVYRKDGKVYANLRFVANQPGNLWLVGITGNIINSQKVTGNGIYELGSPKVLGVYVISFVSQGRIHSKKIFIPE